MSTGVFEVLFNFLFKNYILLGLLKYYSLAQCTISCLKSNYKNWCLYSFNVFYVNEFEENDFSYDYTVN